MTDVEIKELRESMGLTQQDFATLIPVKLSTVQTWESGKFKPRPVASARLEQLKRNKSSKGIRNDQMGKKNKRFSG